MVAAGCSQDLCSAPAAEDALKSVVVLNFLRYSTWPESAVGNGPLVVGVVGRPSFARFLQTSLANKTVNGRAIRILEINLPPDPQCCQLVYIAGTKVSEIRPVLQNMRLAPVLTVGESQAFIECGGAVNLMLVDGHMSFEVNLEALKRSEIEISATLLRFGQIKRRPG